MARMTEQAAAKEGWQAAAKDGESTTVDVSTRWQAGEKYGRQR